MGFLSLSSAVLAAAAVALPGFGKYLAIGLGILAIGAGVMGWRRAAGQPRARLAGAAGVAVGAVALLLGSAKLGLTLVALDRLTDLLSR